MHSTSSEFVPVKSSSSSIGDIAAQWKDPSIKANQFQLNIAGKTFKADPGMDPNGVPVFDGVSNQKVKDCAWQLMQSVGAKDFPAPVTQGGITRYTFKDPDTGASITLRDFSSSASSTGAKWAIDINKHPDFAMSGGKISKAELKFK
ncbi:hypothetical protein [Ralstonia syzygii]|uniref:hypothetical protein n=1 Tax=Ralstonia syzygii TaxID=28097 RepID=UPI0018D038DE|nr:hypothetical protein [Ralstonia syzygii]